MKPVFSVLLVDTHATMLNVNKALFENCSDREFHVMLATNGQQAIEMMENHPFNVVITEFELPLANGRKVVEKALEIYPPETIILITSVGLPDGLQETVDWINEKHLPVVHKSRPFEEMSIATVVLKIIQTQEK